MYKGVQIGMTEAAIITAFSMAVVFIALLAISYIIDLMRIVFDKKGTSKKESKNEGVESMQSKENNAGNDEVMTMEEETQIVAAITAAVAMMLAKDASEFIVRNIKRSPDLDPIWAQAGRMKLMR